MKLKILSWQTITLGDRVGPVLTGAVPEDFQLFVTLAHATYAKAGVAPHTAKMTKRNYAPARLATLVANLESFTEDKSYRD